MTADEIAALLRNATPGPWAWEVNPSQKRVELCGGKGASDLTVLSFARWGLQGAAPQFWRWNGNIADEPKRADACAIPAPGREHHAHWFQRIEHPDAALIAAAPTLARTALDALAEVERLREENGRLRAMFRVNMLRLVSDISHADIDILLDGDARAAIGDKGAGE